MRQPPLILIADDNEANRDILARRLEAHGYQLAMAADGEEALSQRPRTAARSDPPRRHDAQVRRARGVPPAQGRQEPAVHPHHPGYGAQRHQGCRCRPGRRWRRIPDETGRPGRARGARALDPAHQGAARHGARSGQAPYRRSPRNSHSGTARSSSGWPTSWAKSTACTA